nr:zinc finger, BED-type, phospholipase-like, homeodomain-like protein [Tanacetum cinerariifolium]
MATQSTSTSVGVGSSNEPTIVEVIETTRNKDIWQYYGLCKMSDGSKKGRCKQRSKFISVASNPTLRLHFEKPYCPVLKVVPDGVQSSMSREGGLCAYETDRVRQQFVRFVIQQGYRNNPKQRYLATLRSLQDADVSKKGRCKQCGKFISAASNSTLRLHFEKPYCPVLKVVPDGGKSSMPREGGLFAYEVDRVRQQFARFVIQQDAQERIQHTSNLEGDCLEIEQQLLEVEEEAGYAINIAYEEINLEEQAMSGSGDSE